MVYAVLARVLSHTSSAPRTRGWVAGTLSGKRISSAATQQHLLGGTRQTCETGEDNSLTLCQLQNAAVSTPGKVLQERRVIVLRNNSAGSFLTQASREI